MNLNQRIKYARKIASLTQDELAKIMGVSTTAVQFWESEDENKATNPVKDKMPKLAKALSVNYIWLETGHGSHSDDVKDSSGIYLTNTKYNNFPLTSWQKLDKFLSPNKNNKENGMTTINGKIGQNAFVINMDTDEYQPYINRYERAIIDPDQECLGKRALVRIKGQLEIMEFTRMDADYLKSMRQGYEKFKISEGMEYEIIGRVVRIISSRDA